MVPYLRVGVFASTHGVKGEINVFPTVDDPARFKALRRVFFETKTGMKEAEVESVRFHKEMVLVKLRGLETIDDVLSYKGLSLYVAREDAVKLPEGRYYIADLLQCRAVTDDGRELGAVRDVLETGANDVLVVRGRKDGKAKELLIPYIESCVLNVDIEAGIITVHLLDGLEDL